MGVIAQAVKVCLCSIFFLSGVCKLTPKWEEDVYAGMDAAFRDKLTPFWQQMFCLSEIGVELDASLVKVLFGSMEVLCAFLMFTPYKFFASIMLFGLMSAVVLAHIFLGEFAEIPMPLMLCCTSLGICYIGGGPGKNQSA